MPDSSQPCALFRNRLTRLDANGALFLVFGLILLGTWFTWLYQDLPIIRNSILFAGIIQGIEQEGLSAAIDYAGKKPLGFAILSWPVTALTGVNLGLKYASWLWTTLWCFSVYFTLKHLIPNSPQKPVLVTTACLISLFNPLTLYQFMSAYPDSLFASLFLLSVVFFDRALSANGQHRDLLLAGGLALFSIWVKHHGFILLALFPCLAWLKRRQLAEIRIHKPALLLTGVITGLLMALILYGAQQGYFTLFNLGKNVRNFTGGQDRSIIVMRNSLNFAVYLLVCFSVLTPLLLRFPRLQRRGWLTVILALFVLPILYYQGARYNIRYFIAITPLLAWGITSNLYALPDSARKVLLGAFFLINSLTVFYYNHMPFHLAIKPWINLPAIDNLRLTDEQFRESRHLQWIHDYALEYDNTLVYLSRYYGRRTYGIWEKAGFFPAEMRVIYRRYWSRWLIKKHTIKKAIIYEHLGKRSSKNRVAQDKTISQRIQPVSEQLILLNEAR